MPLSLVGAARRERPNRFPGVVRLSLRLTFAALLVSQSVGAIPANAVSTDVVVFREALSQSWSNWSWGGVVDFAHQPGYEGVRSIGWRVSAPWAGLYLHAFQPIPTVATTSVHFALRTTDPASQLSLRLYGANDLPVGSARLLSEFGSPSPAGAWKTYDISISALGAAGASVAGIVLQDATGVAWKPLVEVDDLVLRGVTQSAPAEVRPGNAVPNSTRGRPTRPELFNVDPSFRPYYDKINGDFVGTTEEILDWAARKWGFDRLGYPDLAKAMAVIESWWHQSAVNTTGPVGILQVNPNAWPDSDPARWSTAYNADYAMAAVRYLYDPGSWLGGGTVGSIRNAVAAWECGCGYNGGAYYANQVFTYYTTKPWLRPGLPPEWF